ncbi:hypothetical protein FJR75_09340 [Thermus thermophilus]|nr:hypothetical protein [Thermus thermophilus]
MPPVHRLLHITLDTTGSREEEAVEDLWERRTPEELWQWAKDPKPLVRRRAAENPHTPPEILEGLAEDEDLWVRRAVAANPSTPGETLRKLARDKEISVRKAVAGNPSAPAETLAELAKNEDIEFGIGVALAGNPRTPGEALARLAAGEHPRIRETVAKNPSTPGEVLIKLAEDKELIAKGPRKASRAYNKVRRLPGKMEYTSRYLRTQEWYHPLGPWERPLLFPIRFRKNA